MIVVIVAKHGTDQAIPYREVERRLIRSSLFTTSVNDNGTAFHFETIPLSLLLFIATFTGVFFLPIHLLC